MQVFCQYAVSYFFIEIGKFLRLLEKGLLTKENLDQLDEFKKDPNNNEDDEDFDDEDSEDEVEDV